MRKQRRKIKMKNNTTKNAESLEAVTHTHTHLMFTKLVDSLERESYTLVK
jgi:hypothetical protein